MDFEKKGYEKEYNGKNIIITGGLGFIGSNLAHKLVELNPNKIVIIDALIKNHGGSIKNIRGIEDKLEVPYANNGLNINDRRVINYLEGIDYVFNLAGSVRHIDSKNDPLTDLELNLTSHVAFLDFCKDYVKKGNKIKILFSATRDIYGKTSEKDLPIKEDFLTRDAADPQGIHNHSAEFHHLWYGRTFNFPVVSLRLTNTYGPRQKINDPSQGFLGYFIYQALKNKEIQLWGGGESLRDFNYVDDVIDAMLMSMVSQKTDNKIYNLGSFMRKNGKYQDIGNNLCSIKDATEKIIKIAGAGTYKKILYPEEKKSIEPGHVYLDATKIHNDIEWEPKTSFDEGIRKNIEFYKKNREYLE
ncbi:MAG: NAD-dependent epimerase/dehydratase family protein [Nanoarchaeota archaeon]